MQLVVTDLDMVDCADTTALLLEDCSPLCDVAITNAVANCLDNVSFEVDLSFTGTGSNFEVSVLGGQILDTLSAGTYTFGPFASTQGVQLVVTDLDMVDCADTTALLLEDCSPLCDVAITNAVANCLDNVSFEVDLSFTGTGSNFEVSVLGGQILDTLSAGTYTFGPFASTQGVQLVVTDLDMVDCADTTALLLEDCSPLCDVAITNAVANCLDNVSFEVDLSFTGTGSNFEVSVLGGQILDTLSAGTYTFGPFASTQGVQLVVTDLDMVDCADTTALLLEDCSPLCDLAITNAVANCIDNVSFEVDLSFTGTGSNFEVSILGGAKLDTLSAGTYTFGPFLSTQGVQLVVTDLDMVDCADTTALLLEDCSPLCDVAITNAVANCIDNVSFEVDLSFTGTGSNFEVSILGGAKLDTLSAGTYTFGPFSSTQGVQLVVTDLDNVDCADTTALLLEDCSPLCDVAITNAVANCLDNVSFEVDLSFTGTGNNFEVSILGGAKLDTVSAGTYTFGPFVSTQGVQLVVTDLDMVDCADTTALLLEDCSLLCDVAIDTLFAQCVPSITTDSFQAVVGISGTTGPYRTIIEDIASQILLDTTLVSGVHTVGFYANSTQIRARVEDPDDPSCSAVSPLITADCTPVVDCDSMVIDSVWAVCVSNDSFEVFMAFQGQVTQPYRIQALQSVTFATVTLPGLSPGIYSLGRFVSGNGVSTFLAAENQTTCVKMGATVNLNCAGVFPPVNDSCANATPLNCGDVVTGSFGGATNAGAPTTRCAGVRPRGVGVWFTFQGDGNTITLSTCNSVPALNTQLFIYSGTCGSLTCEMSNDDGTNCFGGTSELSFQTVVGTTYYIYLTDASITGGDYTLEVGCTRSLQPNPVLISIGRTNLGNDLSWSMEEVGGLQGYVVERKLAGEDDFSEIAFVPAEGTIGDKVAYSHQDYDLHGEKVHTYRIRAEFRNDLPTFSEVKQVWVGILDRFHVGTLYPNPAEEVTHLEVQTDKAQPLQWKLYNMQGMELRSETLPLDKGEYTLTIDLHGLSQGSYRLVILGPEGPVHRTILVQ